MFNFGQKSNFDPTKQKLNNLNNNVTVRAPLKAEACTFFTPFFTAVYIVERLVLQTIFQFFGLKSAVYTQERVIMACVRQIIYLKLFFGHWSWLLVRMNVTSGHYVFKSDEVTMFNHFYFGIRPIFSIKQGRFFIPFFDEKFIIFIFMSIGSYLLLFGTNTLAQ